MTNNTPQAPHGEFVLFTSADGRTHVECRFESDTLWLSQATMAELYDKDVRTINEHLINIGRISFTEFDYNLNVVT